MMKARKNLQKQKIRKAKELHEKGAIPGAAKKMRQMVDNAKDLRRQAMKTRSTLRSWKKKAEDLSLKLRTTNAKVAQAKVKMDAAMEESGKDKKKAEATTAAVAKASADKAEAKSAVEKASSKSMTATGKGKALGAKTGLKAAEDIAAKSRKAFASKRAAADAATGTEKASSAAVTSTTVAFKAAQSGLKKLKVKLEKAQSMISMYQTKVDAADAVAKEAESVASSHRQYLNQLMEEAVHRPNVVKVVSGTYYCPKLADPITKKEMTKAQLLDIFAGNQTATLSQACNGNEDCKYVVDSKIIGQPTPGCAYWAYHAEIQCVKGKPRRPGTTVKPPPGLKEMTALLQTRESKETLKTKVEELKAELKASKKKAPVKDMPTEQALDKGFQELQGVSPGMAKVVKKKKVGKKSAIPKIPVQVVELAQGGDKRVLRLKCKQKKMKSVQKAEEKAKKVRKAVRAEKKVLRKTARKEERKIERKISKDKLVAEEKQQEASHDQAAVLKLKEKVVIDSVKVDNLKQAVQDAPTKAAVKKMEKKLDKVVKDQQKQVAAEEEVKKETEMALEKAKVAKKEQKKEERKIGLKPDTEVKTSEAVKRAEGEVKSTRASLQGLKSEMNALIEALKKVKTPQDQMGLMGRMTKMAMKLEAQRVLLKKAKRARDVALVGVDDKAEENRKHLIVKKEKNVVADETEIKAIEMEISKMGPPPVANPAQKAALEEKLKAAKARLEQAKSKVAKVQFAPVLSEVSAVAESQKEALVAERKKVVKKGEKLVAIIQQRLDAASAALKTAKSSEEVSTLMGQMVEIRTELDQAKKRLNKKQAKLADAMKVKSLSVKGMVQKVEKSVSNAKTKIAKLQATQTKVDKKIAASKDPVAVKEEAKKLANVKKEMAAEQRAVARREVRVTKIEKIKRESPTPKKKMTAVQKLEQTSPKVETEAKAVQALEVKRQSAKAAVAAAISVAFAKKVGKETAGLKAAKAALKAEAEQVMKLMAETQTLAKGGLDKGAGAKMLQAVKDAWIEGRYEDVLKLHKEHAKKTAQKKTKTTLPNSADRVLYNVHDPKSGVCRQGNCCLTTYDDFSCKEKRNSLCVPVTSNETAAWSDLMQTKTVFVSDPKTASTQSKSRKLNMKIMWNPVPNGQQLRLLVCGEFTPQGSNACYPEDKKDETPGIPLATVFNAPAGKCIQAKDFADVSKSKLKEKLLKFMSQLSTTKQVAKATKKDEKKVEALNKAQNMQKDVKRAVVGAFKGSLGGLGESLSSIGDKEVVSLDELVDLTVQNAEYLLTKTGSFKVTQGGTAANTTAAANITAV